MKGGSFEVTGSASDRGGRWCEGSAGHGAGNYGTGTGDMCGMCWLHWCAGGASTSMAVTVGRHLTLERAVAGKQGHEGQGDALPREAGVPGR